MEKWRRGAGASVMTLGAVVFIAMVALASIAIAHYIEWENGADAMRTVAVITLPPAIAGVGLVILGRWIHGGWRDRTPIRNASGVTAGVLGLAVAAIFSAELIVQLATGTAVQATVTALGIGAALGLAIILVGFRLRADSKRIRRG